METKMYSRILITTDGSELSGKGLAEGLALAKALGSEVTVLNVSEPWTPIGVQASETLKIVSSEPSALARAMP